MKTTLFMAVSINRYVAGPNDNTDWVRDTALLAQIIKEYGACVMGRRTYDICVHYNDFPFKNALNIVMTHDKTLIEKSKETEIFTDKGSTEVVKIVESKGIQQMIVLGGGNINSQFLAAGLIDDMIIDVHPIVLEKGTKLFEDLFPHTNLELIESKILNDGIVQNHYKVIK